MPLIEIHLMQGRTAQEKKMELQRAFRLRAPADAARPVG